MPALGAGFLQPAYSCKIRVQKPDVFHGTTLSSARRNSQRWRSCLLLGRTQNDIRPLLALLVFVILVCFVAHLFIMTGIGCRTA